MWKYLKRNRHPLHNKRVSGSAVSGLRPKSFVIAQGFRYPLDVEKNDKNKCITNRST